VQPLIEGPLLRAEDDDCDSHKEDVNESQ